MVTNDPENMNVKEAADFLRISVYTLYKLAARNEIPAFRIGGQWRFRMSVLQEWIAKQEETHVAK